MQHQFKAGDLALTLAECGDVLTGSCVEIFRVMPAGEVFSMGGRDHLNEHERVIALYGPWKYLYRKNELMPLKGDQSPVKTNTETPREVVHG